MQSSLHDSESLKVFRALHIEIELNSELLSQQHPSCFSKKKTDKNLLSSIFFPFIKIGYKIGNRKIRNTNSLDFKLMRFYISEDP